MAEETKKKQKTIPTTTTTLLLVLPYLPPPTLAALSLTSTTLRRAVSTLTTLRSSDASLGLEPQPIPFRNAVDSHPYAFFLYTPTPLLPHQPPPLRREGSGVGVRVEVVRCRRKGWGLFAPEGVREGVFVCEYAGEYLTNTEAKRRQIEYDKLTASSKFSPALIVLREHLPSGKACLRVNIDATRIGNVARFINHSCDGGNLSPVIVRNSGSVLPRLCFFAARDIKEGGELTFCYGDVKPRPNGAPCYCGSSGCLGMLPSEET